MSVAVPSLRAFTVADLATFPDDGRRYEAIDGELYVSTAPHSDHQDVLTNLSLALGGWDPLRARGWPLVGTGVIFAADTGVIPDLVWISQARYADVLINPETGRRDGKLYRAPDLAVEVLSPGADNIARDRQTKLTLYSRRGVGEYWIVDRLAGRIEIYRRGEQAGLELVATLLPNDRLTSPLLPGFALPVAAVFRLPEGLPA